MRFRTLWTAATLIMVLTVSLGAQDLSKAVIGQWTGQRPAEGRINNFTFTFTSTDKGLGGTVQMNSDAVDMADIVVNEKTHQVTFSGAGVDFVATVEGKTMTVTANFDGRELWTMTLAKKDKA
jgi:hypothetical protein